MLSAYKPTAEKYLRPFIQYFSKVSPNTLTLLGSIPPVLFFVFMIYHWYILALIALVGNGLDMLDGMVARKYHKVTQFGGFLDSTMDRVADFLIITAFAFAHIVSWKIVAPFLLFAYLTSYVRSRGELANPKVSFAMGIIERPERLVLVFVTLTLYIIFPSATFMELNIASIIFIFILLLSFYTVFQRIAHAYKNL